MRYVDVFLNDRPRESFDLLSTRLKKAKGMNDELAEFFKERAFIEEAYSKALSKLANKKFSSDKTVFGSLGSVWSQIVYELQETSNIHANFSRKLLDEVSKPLRDSHNTDPEWSSLKTHEASISKIIKDYDDMNARMSKHKKNADKNSGKKAATAAKKLAESSKALNDAVHSWIQDAPALFNKYNQIDERRFGCLQTTFSRYVELEIELSKAQTEQYGKTLNSIVQFNIQEEMDSFCANKPLGLEKIVSLNESVSNRGPEPAQYDNQPHRSTTDQSVSYLQPAQSNTFNFDEPASFNNNSNNPFGDSTPAAPVIDSEGFSVPPEEPASWSQVSGENYPYTEDASEANQTRMKIDIKDRIITEEPAEASKALTRVSSTLRLKNTIKRNTVRGRRDARSRLSSLDQVENNQMNGSQISPGSTTTAASVEARLEPLDGAINGTANGNNTSRFKETKHDTIARHDSVIPRLSMFSSNLSLSSGNSEHTVISETNGLKGFISEVVNVLISNGQISKVFITGEVCISGATGASSNPLRMTIKDVKSFERLIPNQTLISPIDEESGIFELNVGLLAQINTHKATIFKYQLHIDEAQRSQYVPILLNSVWKCEETLTSLVITYQANPDCLLTGKLSEASIVLPVDNNVTHVQSKPLGIWNAEKQRLLWQTADIDFSSREPHKLLARFETKSQGCPAPIAAKFTHKESILSPMHFELSGLDNGSVNLHYKLTSGKYIATPDGISQ